MDSRVRLGTVLSSMPIKIYYFHSAWSMPYTSWVVDTNYPSKHRFVIQPHYASYIYVIFI